MEESVPPGSVCCFCLSSHEDEALYGKFYKIEEITTHYFCLLLSSKVQQRGSDDEGILGFLAKDIRNEVRRGKNLVCAYCHKRGATISCHNSKCKLHFHLPCGRAKDTFHQFFGEFKSFCFKHRKSQSIKKEVLKAMSGKQSTCSICLESVPATPSPNTLWAPCCSKEAWFHRLCIQRLALSAGYFFKCPLCNNTNRFVESMRTCGIWIPEQDASWERDPNRYDGLLQRHNSCDAKSCRCKQGRTFHMENTKWEIKLCADCGSQGMHVHCGNLRVTQDWVCAICANVLTSKKEEEQNKPGKILLSRQAIRARNRARRGLPGRPARRLTRLQQLHASEDGEEEERETDKMAAITAPPSPGLIKGASSSQKSTPSAPQKEAPRPIKPTASKSMQQELIPQTVQRASENSDVEIIDVGDDSDDEVQILPSPNIRFIKTNIGFSVPVMTLDASQPGGKEVIASGEPCQPTACSDPSANSPSVKDIDFSGLCEPSTSSQCVDVNEVDGDDYGDPESVFVSGGDPESAIVSGDDPETAFVSEISATGGSSPYVSDEDDVIELEAPQPAAPNPVGIERPSVIISPDNNRNVVNHEGIEGNSLQTSMPVRNAYGPTLTIRSSVPPLDTLRLPSGDIPSSEPTDSSYSFYNKNESFTDSPVKYLPSHNVLRMLLNNEFDKMRSTSVPQNEYSFVTKAAPIPPVAAFNTTQLLQSRVPPVEPEFHSTRANVSHSLTENNQNSETPLSESFLPIITSVYSTAGQSNAGLPTMSEWHSKLLQRAREDPNFDPFSSSSVTVARGRDLTLPESGSIAMYPSHTFSSSNHPTIPKGSFSSIPDPRTHRTSSSHFNSLIKENSSRKQIPMFSNLHNQSVQDDWTVEVVPTNNQVGPNSFMTAQSAPVLHPSLVCERSSEAVVRDNSLWQDEGSSESDEIIVVDDEPSRPLVQPGTSGRKRKQNLVARNDLTQVRFFPPALLPFCPQICQNEIDFFRR